MAVYKTKEFARWARKQDLQDEALCRAVAEMAAGLYDADLGGHLFKKRIARTGQGKSGGFRTLVATNMDDVWIFLYGFAKNERGNVDRDEELALKKWAAVLIELAPSVLRKTLVVHDLIEVDCNG